MINHLEEPVHFAIEVNWTQSETNCLRQYWYPIKVYTDEDLEKSLCDLAYLENFMRILQTTFYQVNRLSFLDGSITTKVIYNNLNTCINYDFDPDISTDFLYSNNNFILIKKEGSIKAHRWINFAQDLEYEYVWSDERPLAFIVRPVETISD